MPINYQQPRPDAESLPSGFDRDAWLLLDNADFQTSMQHQLPEEPVLTRPHRPNTEDNRIRHAPRFLSHKIPSLVGVPDRDLQTAKDTRGKFRIGDDFIIFRSKGRGGSLFLGSNTRRIAMHLQPQDISQHRLRLSVTLIDIYHPLMTSSFLGYSGMQMNDSFSAMRKRWSRGEIMKLKTKFIVKPRE